MSDFESAPHLVMAQPAYWADEARALPKIDIFAQGFDSLFDDTLGGHRYIVSSRLKRSSDWVSEPIYPGDELPLLVLGAEALVRVVSERRMPVRRGMTAPYDSAEVFDELVAEMRAKRKYTGDAASFPAESEEGQAMTIGQSVVYFVTSATGNQLAGRTAAFATDLSEAGGNMLLPSIVVGDLYRRGRHGGRFRVSQAELLRPEDGYDVRKVRRPKRAKALGGLLRPNLAPGF